MPNIINLRQLEEIDYNFLQVTSLEKTFGNFGLDSNNYMKQDIFGISTTNISVLKIIHEISNIIGVAESSIISLKAPQASTNITGIAVANGKPIVVWSGRSMMLAVSYLNIDEEIEYSVFTFSEINGSLKLIEQTKGEFNQFNNIDGSYNLVELLSGSN